MTDSDIGNQLLAAVEKCGFKPSAGDFVPCSVKLGGVRARVESDGTLVISSDTADIRVDAISAHGIVGFLSLYYRGQ